MEKSCANKIKYFRWIDSNGEFARLCIYGILDLINVKGDNIMKNILVGVLIGFVTSIGSIYLYQSHISYTRYVNVSDENKGLLEYLKIKNIDLIDNKDGSVRIANSDASVSVLYAYLSITSKKKDIISKNISNVDSVEDPDRKGKPYFSRELIIHEDGETSIKADTVASGRKKYMPEHPLADENGYVFMPNINVVTEMVQLIEVSREYNVTKDILLKFDVDFVGGSLDTSVTSLSPHTDS